MNGGIYGDLIFLLALGFYKDGYLKHTMRSLNDGIFTVFGRVIKQIFLI